jgi:hypothetical protein
MPVKGAGIKRGEWFHDAKRIILNHGFQSGAPGRMACPGFHFFSRAGFVLQIMPALTLGIRRPDGTEQRIPARNVGKLDSILDALILELESSEEKS